MSGLSTYHAQATALRAWTLRRHPALAQLFGEARAGAPSETAIRRAPVDASAPADERPVTPAMPLTKRAPASSLLLTEASEALVSLGYKAAAVRKLAAAMPPPAPGTPVEEVIGAMLRAQSRVP